MALQGGHCGLSSFKKFETSRFFYPALVANVRGQRTLNVLAISTVVVASMERVEHCSHPASTLHEESIEDDVLLDDDSVHQEEDEELIAMFASMIEKDIIRNSSKVSFLLKREFCIQVIPSISRNLFQFAVSDN